MDLNCKFISSIDDDDGIESRRRRRISRRRRGFVVLNRVFVFVLLSSFVSRSSQVSLRRRDEISRIMFQGEGDESTELIDLGESSSGSSSSSSSMEDTISNIMFQGDDEDSMSLELLEERVSTSRIEDIMFKESSDKEHNSDKQKKKNSDTTKNVEEERFQEDKEQTETKSQKGFTFPVHPGAFPNVLPQLATSALPQALHYGGGQISQVGASHSIAPILNSASSVLTGLPYANQGTYDPRTVLTTQHPVASPMGSAVTSALPQAMYANSMLPTSSVTVPPPVGFQQHPSLGFGQAASQGGLPTYSRNTGFTPGIGFSSVNSLPTYTRPTSSDGKTTTTTGTTATTINNMQPFVYNTLGGIGAPSLLHTPPMPPMPPSSTSYGEMAAPPPPSIITNTPDVLPSPMPPILPHQMRRFATSNDVGRGFAPAGTEETGHRGAVDVHLSAYPGRAPVQADPSAPLSRMETEGRLGGSMPSTMPGL